VRVQVLTLPKLKTGMLSSQAPCLPMCSMPRSAFAARAPPCPSLRRPAAAASDGPDYMEQLPMLRGHPVPRAVLVMVGTQLLASALEQAMCTLALRLIQGLVRAYFCRVGSQVVAAVGSSRASNSICGPCHSQDCRASQGAEQNSLAPWRIACLHELQRATICLIPGSRRGLWTALKSGDVPTVAWNIFKLQEISGELAPVSNRMDRSLGPPFF